MLLHFFLTYRRQIDLFRRFHNGVAPFLLRSGKHCLPLILPATDEDGNRGLRQRSTVLRLVFLSGKR